MPNRPIRPLELTELKTLVVCADTGSFAAAAEHLDISRVAVTKRITNMEAVTGQPLLERTSRGVRLTESGARLCAQAQVALKHSDAMTEFVAKLRGEPRSVSAVRSLFADAAADRVGRGPEAQLAGVHMLFEQVFDASATGLTLIGMDDSVIVDLNEASCRFFGRPREELIGKSTLALGIWLSLEERALFIEELRASGSCTSVPVRVRRPNGEVAYGEISARVMKFGSRDLAISSMLDVSHAHAVDAAQLDAMRWRRTADFASAVAAGEVPDAAQAATELLVDQMGHLSAAVIVQSEGAPSVVAHSGAGVEWSEHLGRLPTLDGACRALRRAELDLLDVEWGCVAPIGDGGMLITVAPDKEQRDPARVDAVARVVRAALVPQPA